MTHKFPDCQFSVIAFAPMILVKMIVAKIEAHLRSFAKQANNLWKGAAPADCWQMISPSFANCLAAFCTRHRQNLASIVTLTESFCTTWLAAIATLCFRPATPAAKNLIILANVCLPATGLSAPFAASRHFCARMTNVLIVMLLTKSFSEMSFLAKRAYSTWPLATASAPVKLAVLALAFAKFKIAYSIIVWFPIPMVDHFHLRQIPSEVPFHDKSMLSNIPTLVTKGVIRALHQDITIAINFVGSKVLQEIGL